MKLVNIGFGNLVNADRIITVVSPESSPMKRLIANAKETGKLIDATQGRKTCSVIFMDSEHIILSYLTPEKMVDKMNQEENTNSED